MCEMRSILGAVYSRIKQNDHMVLRGKFIEPIYIIRRISIEYLHERTAAGSPTSSSRPSGIFQTLILASSEAAIQGQK